MMKQKKLPNRRSMRLQGYDYSSPGFYFITICTNQKECLFGDVINGEMHMNECGVVAHNEWFKTELIRDNVRLDEFVVMPNHVHGIIEIIDKNPIVGANRDSPLRNKIGINNSFYKSKFESPSNNIGAIIRGYKSSVTKQINLIRKTPGTKILQRGYYDHIIRNEESLFYIREYIKNNPKNWNKDRFYQNR
ncbi:MAG: transposase [Balneola sp.]